MRPPVSSRRQFLCGAAALAVSASAVPIGAMAGPVLYGDGLHDDADALNSLFAGNPVTILNDAVEVRDDGVFILRGGRFLIGKTINITGVDCHIEDCEFLQNGGFIGDCMLNCERGSFSFIRISFENVSIFDKNVNMPGGMLRALK